MDRWPVVFEVSGRVLDCPRFAPAVYVVFLRFQPPPVLRSATPSRKRILAARALAVIADAIQIGLLPLFVQGAASPLNDALDVVVGAGMVALVGWNWVFLPTFVAELVPFLDIAPTWTVAAFIATRARKVEALPASTPPP